MKLKCYIKHKTIITNIIIFFVIFYLLLNSKILVASISSSCNIFLSSLLPALFPYLFITEILINSNKITNLSLGIETLLSKMFKVPPNATSCIVVGFLLGYPNSAKYIAKLYSKKEIDYPLAKKLVSFTSNANMSYIIATIGLTIFKSFSIGIILLISHFLSAIIIGMFVSSYNNNIIQQTKTNSNSFEKIYSPFELLYISIYGTLKTLGFIFAYTIIFSLIPQLVFNLLPLSKTLEALTLGVFEISNGVKSLSCLNISLSLKLVLISFVLSFSSFMILTQIFSFIYTTKVKFKDLLKYKFLQGVVSSIITYVIMHFYTPIVPALLNLDNYTKTVSYLPDYAYLIILLIVCIIVF